MFFGKLFGSSFRFRCRDLRLPRLLAASVFAVPAHHLPAVFESELSMSRGSVCVCVEKQNSIQLCVWLGSNLLPVAFFATSTLSLAASRHASLRAVAKADTMTQHSTTTTAAEQNSTFLPGKTESLNSFRSRDVILSENKIRRFRTKNVSHKIIFEYSVQRTSLTKRQARGKTGKNWVYNSGGDGGRP